MGIQIWELFGSRESSLGQDARTAYKFALYGSNDEQALKIALAGATTPYNVEGFIRRELSISQEAPFLWTGLVVYQAVEQKRREPLKIGDKEVSFDTSGGEVHLTHSLATKSYAAPGETAPDYKGSIGVSGEGKDMKVEGVDLVIPALTFSLTHYLPKKIITLDYLNVLYSLTGKTNEDRWKGFDAGELLFMGARGEQRGDDDYKVAFNFVGSENVKNLKIGDITVAKKLGHQYLWVRYAPEDDTDSGFVVPKALAVYVETVYRAGDFSKLKIGT